MRTPTQEINAMVASKISDELLKPVVNNIGNTIVRELGKGVRSVYAGCRNKLHEREFNKAKAAYEETELQNEAGNQPLSVRESCEKAYHEQLQKLMVKCRDPQLFAAIVREGVPVGIHCTQAMAEVLGRRIEITVKEGNSSIPAEYNPSELRDGRPIRLEFVPGANAGAGHFKALGDHMIETGGNVPLRIECLFDAIRATGAAVSRAEIARAIESDFKLQENIRNSFH